MSQRTPCVDCTSAAAFALIAMALGCRTPSPEPVEPPGNQPMTGGAASDGLVPGSTAPASPGADAGAPVPTTPSPSPNEASPSPKQPGPDAPPPPPGAVPGSSRGSAGPARLAH